MYIVHQFNVPVNSSSRISNTKMSTRLSSLVHSRFTFHALRFTNFFLDPDSDLHIIRAVSKGVAQQTFTNHGGETGAHHACKIYHPETRIWTT